MSGAAPAERPGRDEPTITSEIVARHGLSAEEYDRVVTIMGREPNLLELGIFSSAPQTSLVDYRRGWSADCRGRLCRSRTVCQ